MWIFLAGFWMIMFRFQPAKRKSILIELTSFKTLFLVKFQISALDESHHLLKTFLRKQL